jgi:hypothetical protein
MYWSSLEGREVLDVYYGDVVVAQECGLNRASNDKLTSKKMVILVVKRTCFFVMLFLFNAPLEVSWLRYLILFLLLSILLAKPAGLYGTNLGEM